jgi:hypothetical protein
MSGRYAVRALIASAAQAPRFGFWCGLGAGLAGDAWASGL